MWAALTSPTNTWAKASNSFLKDVSALLLNSKIPATLPPTSWFNACELLPTLAINTASSGLVALRPMVTMLLLLLWTRYWPEGTSPIWTSTEPLARSTATTRSSLDIPWINVSLRSKSWLGWLLILDDLFNDELMLASWLANWFSSFTLPFISL